MRLLLQASGALAAALLAGCVVIPIPLPETGQPKAIEQLRIGSTSRAEVLLALGHARWRGQDDRVLEYEWKATVGAVAIGVPGGGGVGPLTKVRRLCLEFDEQGILTGTRFLERDLPRSEGIRCSQADPQKK